jgi:hypothetical protein
VNYLQRQIDSLPAPVFTAALAVFVMLYVVFGPVVAYLAMGGKP